MRPRRSLFAAAGLLACVAAASTATAQSPFSGTWKLNQEKSHLAGDILKFGPAQGNAMELTSGAPKYSFRADGNNYRMPSGDLAIWREAGTSRWTTDYKKPDGKLLSTDTWTSPPTVIPFPSSAVAPSRMGICIPIGRITCAPRAPAG